MRMSLFDGSQIIGAALYTIDLNFGVRILVSKLKPCQPTRCTDIDTVSSKDYTDIVPSVLSLNDALSIPCTLCEFAHTNLAKA